MFASKHILTVDDSPTLRKFLRNILNAEGAQVDEAGSGAEALEKCAGSPRYDLILLDLMLPDTSGLQVLKRLREKDAVSAIAMLTGGGGIQSALEAVRQGADAYVEKQALMLSGDYTNFLYTLEQAIKSRAGIVAQQQLLQLKTDFYSMVTHDLRNPAGSIQVMLHMLYHSQPDAFTPDQLEILGLLNQSAQRLMTLIDNYLDFAKIDAGYLKLTWAEADVRALVQDRVRLMEPQARLRKQTLALTLPPAPLRAYVDAERLAQAFENLLSNAIKYTPEEGQISVELAEAPGQFIFRVSDTGPGIAPEQLPALFTKYHRLPGEAVRGIHGTGLGLLIVKEVVAAHGGEVTAASPGASGTGAEFTLCLPRRPARPE